MIKFLQKGFFSYPPFSFLFFIFLFLLNQDSYQITITIYVALLILFLAFKFLFNFISKFNLSTQMSSILVLYSATIVMIILHLIFKVALVNHNYLYSYMIMISFAFIVLLAYIETSIFESSLTSSVKDIIVLLICVACFTAFMYVSNIVIKILFDRLNYSGLLDTHIVISNLYWVGLIKNALLFAFSLAFIKKITRRFM